MKEYLVSARLAHQISARLLNPFSDYSNIDFFDLWQTHIHIPEFFSKLLFWMVYIVPSTLTWKSRFIFRTITKLLLWEIKRNKFHEESEFFKFEMNSLFFFLIYHMNLSAILWHFIFYYLVVSKFTNVGYKEQDYTRLSRSFRLIKRTIM